MVCGKSKSSVWGELLKDFFVMFNLHKFAGSGRFISNLTCTYFSNWVLEFFQKKKRQPSAENPMDFSQAAAILVFLQSWTQVWQLFFSTAL